jgi:uncharacterized protein YgiM (DUF1202 family)
MLSKKIKIGLSLFTLLAVLGAMNPAFAANTKEMSGLPSKVMAYTNRTGVVNTPLGLNVRKEPSMNSSIICAISYGTEVYVEGLIGGWVLVRLKDSGIVGYVYGEYLTINY